jgi:hypothetical protein
LEENKWEPEYSDKMLKQYEEKYNIPSDMFYKAFKTIWDNYDFEKGKISEDVRDWVSNYKTNCFIKFYLKEMKKIWRRFK